MNIVNAKALQQLKKLSPVPLPQLEKLAAHLAVKHVKKSEIIFDQDESGGLVYLLLSGVVRVSYNSPQKQTIVSLLSAGEFFGLDSLVPKSTHAFRCDAYENSVVASIKPQIFSEIILEVPYESFLRWYTAIMYPTRQMLIHCIKGIGVDLRKRLALELLNLAERFGTAGVRGIVIVLNITHEVLASIVGASRQQVTEHLNEFDREKIILRERRRIIINAQKLKRIIEAE